ncbi:MAG: C45 family autoproteolytic acyltransferase/hydrolase [Planctomycetota bacterium]
MQRRLEAIIEPDAGEAWQALFDRMWPGYRSWYLREGEAARPTFLDCRSNLRRAMPKLRRTYEGLVELAGGGDIEARFLSLYNPPAFLAGCSQLVHLGDEPILIRNYDYHPQLWEAVLLGSSWTGQRVLAMSDCLWGVLDGINEAGVCVALAFGGRRVTGDGFGAPLILRNLLENCTRTRDAEALLRKSPSHMSYTITVLDRRGEHVTAYLSPDRSPHFTREMIATNHQLRVEWPEHAAATATVERRCHLEKLVSAAPQPLSVEDLIPVFLSAPIRSASYARGFGTLYTAVYRPARGLAEYHWPGKEWSFDVNQLVAGSRTLRFAASGR